MSRDWPRTIVHADMDAFYAAVEQMDDPSLRGRPILVGPKSSRGVVLTASYEARPFGVGSAMPMARARRLCPDALVVPPRFERYTEVSRTIMCVFGDFSPRVEALSLDEAFIDMTGAGAVFGAPERIGRRLKDAVRDATGGLTVSVGISGTKFVAKVASDHAKPDGLTIVPPAEAPEWLRPLPVSVLWGAGPKTQEKLERLGLTRIGDVAAADPAMLERRLGRIGRRFHELAHARDERGVCAERAAKSISAECTLPEDVGAVRDLAFQLKKAAEDVGRRLRRKGYRARGVRVKLKTADFRVLSRQRAFAEPTDATQHLYATAVALLREFDDPGPFRLVGLGAYALTRSAGEPQLDLPIALDERQQRLHLTLDRIGRRFGRGAVLSGGDLLRRSRVTPAVNLDFLDADDGPDADDDRVADREPEADGDG